MGTQLSIPKLVNNTQFNALTPNDGDMVIYQADATNGVNWHLRYNAGSASAYKWEVISGSLLIFASTATLPRAGDYNIQWSINYFFGGTGGFVTAAATSGALTGSFGLEFTTGSTAGGTGDGSASLSNAFKVSGCSAGCVLSYSFNNSTNQFTGLQSSVGSPAWACSPIRIS